MEIKKLITYFTQFVTPARLKKIDHLVKERTRHLSIVLEDVFQSHNTGAILRSCEAFGIQDVHCITDRNQLNINKSIASGAAKWLDVNQYQTMGDCVTELKKNGYQLIATSPHAVTPLSEVDITKKTVLLFGTEEEGLSEELSHLSDQQIYIPMYGFTESFNVSVSVALCLYELTKKMRASNVAWQISKEEQEELIFDWLKESVDRPDLLEKRFIEKK
jgi:tRNA (guanosine-2'-O-)-methyltransferase